ncbi:MAG: ADP-ribosylglycohydrolase family protein [Nanoarchaeota archaeon]|nr:ADP-ribosylglycohydrolase family protein [Nanoarchaeota archaeon]
MDILKSYTGTLLGSAIGDAMGAPTEGLSPKEIFDRYGNVTSYIQATPDRRTSGLTPGQYTDDTEMTIAMAESILACKGLDAEDLAKHFIKWYNSPGFSRSRGQTCERAGLALSRGRSWYSSGIVGKAGCGTAMRAHPLGLIHDEYSLDQLTLDVYDASIITHKDTRAVAGTAAVALSIIYLRAHKDTSDLIEFLTYFLPVVENYADKNLNTNPQDPLSKRISRIPIYLAKSNPLIAVKDMGFTGYVNHVVPTAIFHFLKHPDNFLDAVASAVNAGGDADSVACITGALSGAYLGEDSIPQHLLTALEEKDKIKNLGINLLDMVNNHD